MLKQLEARALIRIGAVEKARDILESLHQKEHLDDESLEETLGNLGRVYKDIWKVFGNKSDACKSRDMYLRCFKKTMRYWTGINAAAMSYLVGDLDQAKEIAHNVLEICEKALKEIGRDDLYWVLATSGEAYLFLNKNHKSIEKYRAAFNVYNEQTPSNQKHDQIVSSLQQLRLLKNNDGFSQHKCCFFA